MEFSAAYQAKKVGGTAANVTAISQAAAAGGFLRHGLAYIAALHALNRKKVKVHVASILRKRQRTVRSYVYTIFIN